MRPYDTIIVGGGIIGLAIARELRARHQGMRIAVLDKEQELGMHASGRNSGVLHSGLYYPAGSLKGKICAEGARAMARFCDENALPIQRLGKVILPVRPADDSQLDLLLDRARSNGARARIIDPVELAELEPSARTCSGRALWSPDTAVIDPKSILNRIEADLTGQGVSILKGHQVSGVSQNHVVANQERIGYGFLINAAGLHADVVAKACGVGARYKILPFKGLYYELSASANLKIKRLIYPVPDLQIPFLGIHFTKNTSGRIFVGPSALPALGRENYRGLEGIGLGDLSNIVKALGRQYVSGKQGFRAFVKQEALCLVKSNFVRAAQALVPGVRAGDLISSSKVGIRAQLFDTVANEMVMDFLLEDGPRSVHVLNAVSPGFTSAFAFARLVVDRAGLNGNPGWEDDDAPRS